MKTVKWIDRIGAAIGILMLAAFVQAERGSFRQPEKTPEPPAVVRAAAPPENPVPDIWEIVRNDNQAAAEICAARGKR